MPNPVIVDPEVVNEPKKLEVPQFNKQEIEAISVDATKKAIASGDIQLPPGGTKLYKHVLIASPDTYRYGFIASSNLVATNQTNMNVLNSCIVECIGVGHNQYGSHTTIKGTLQYSGNYGFNAININQSTLALERESFTFVEDVVTEL